MAAILNIRLNIHINMVSKTITIKDDVYRKLVVLKKRNESFSDLFERLVSSRRNIDLLREMRGSVTFQDKSCLLKELQDKRQERRY